MPGLSGHELIARVRQKSPRTITICLSGSSPDDPSQSQTGADAFLRKPCCPKELIAVLQKLLSDRAARLL
jgi:CheY-like chemotaxis protein